MKIHKIYQVVKREIIKKFVYINSDFYLEKYTKYLKEIGVKFIGKEQKIKYIDPSVYFDGVDYSLISIGDNVTISREVMLLTHDYLINTALCILGKRIDRHEGEAHFRKPIKIGNDVFIGARASILPGTEIGDNVIIGAGGVIKGKIAPGCIVVGNPSKIIGKTEEYARLHMDLKDYEVEL